MAFDATAFEIDPLALTTPRARLEYLRDFLRRLPERRFYIGNYVSRRDEEVGHWRSAEGTEVLSDCGTAACIAGWTASLFCADAVRAAYAANWVSPVHEAAANLLGLTSEQAEALFVPLGHGAPRWTDLTAAHAANVVDHLLTTGEVDWSVAVQ